MIKQSPCFFSCLYDGVTTMLPEIMASFWSIIPRVIQRHSWAKISLVNGKSQSETMSWSEAIGQKRCLKESQKRYHKADISQKYKIPEIFQNITQYQIPTFSQKFSQKSSRNPKAQAPDAWIRELLTPEVLEGWYFFKLGEYCYIGNLW